MPDRKTLDDKQRYDHSGHSTVTAEQGDLKTTTSDRPVPDEDTVSVPGGFKNDPEDPKNPDETIEKFRRKNLKP
jgi:hypothetical protein